VSGGSRDHRTARFFVLRTPLLPFDTLLDWAAAGPDKSALLAHLRALVERPDVAEALALASADLGDALADRPSEKVLLALARYVTRMSSRSTPFGLFAGCSVGEIAEATNLELPPLADYARRTDIGLELMLRVSATLDAAARRRAPLIPTSTRYELAGQLRYVEECGLEHPLRAARMGRELRTALALAAGRLPAGELAEALARELGAPPAAAAQYVEQLVTNQILVSDVRPRPTADDPARDFADRLRAIGAPQAGAVDALADELRRIDAAPLGAARYEAVREQLERLVPGAAPDRALVATLRKPAPALALDRRIADGILDAADVLRRLFAPPEADALRVFQEKFRERYDTRFVPLLEALDDELGIGLPGFGPAAADDLPLLRDVPLREKREPATFAPLHAKLLEKLGSSRRDDCREMVLTDADVEAMALPDALPLPNSFAAFGVLTAGGTFVLHAITGPSGAQFLARFCHGDERLADCTREWLREEEQLAENAIFAEVVALPDRRDANLIARPAFTAYEIPFLATSSQPSDRQIEACDLFVGIRGGRLRLWSRSHGREVIARVTNAHNFRARGVSAYRFLGALQRHRLAGALTWDWGPLAAFPDLPRVRYRNVVLARARWTIARSELKALDAEGARRRGMPRFVLLDRLDQELLIDWENRVSIDAFLGAVRDDEVAVKELLPQPEAMAARGPEGRFANEIVIPFLRRRPQEAPKAIIPSYEAPSRVRSFAPGGGEWLYWKLYTGYSTADRLLVESIAPAMRRLQQEGRLGSWFFVRYSDPDHHLRVRVRGGHAGELLEQLGALFASLMEGGSLAKVQLDTYERELERYGGPGQIDRVEALFAVDSAAVVAALPYMQGDATLRWQTAAWGTDRLMDDLDVPAMHKAALLERLCGEFGGELDRGRATREALARKTREVRGRLDAIFDDAALRPWQSAYDDRSRVIASLALRADHEPPFDDGIIASLLHLHLNRVFRSNKREQERVLYDLLLRRERSRAARRARRHARLSNGRSNRCCCNASSCAPEAASIALPSRRTPRRRGRSVCGRSSAITPASARFPRVRTTCSAASVSGSSPASDLRMGSHARRLSSSASTMRSRADTTRCQAIDVNRSCSVPAFSRVANHCP
jgi:thiopeptide-type bacteriocin biosynthesis protein